MNAQESENRLVVSECVACIAIELLQIEEVLKEMNLGVMNAKVLIYRAGEGARAFRPITDFIAEVSTMLSSQMAAISKALSPLSSASQPVDLLWLKSFEGLRLQFEASKQSLLNASVAATLSRIEAASTGCHRKGFEGMAQKLERDVQTIGVHIKRASVQLTRTQEVLSYPVPSPSTSSNSIS